MIDLNNIKKVHFIGIGGIGISALALLMHNDGKIISGTNDNPSPDTLNRIRALGVQINIGADLAKIPPDVDLIVYSLAWDDREPDLMKAVRALGVPVLSYPQALGLVSVAKYTIAISGTHGKTTTTAMIGEMMIAVGLDPTVVVGSLLKDIKSNFVAGQSNYFVVEACEYRRSFLNLRPKIAVITNIDNDHLDYYKDLADIQSAFAEFAEQIPADGFLICDKNDPLLLPVLERTKAQIIDYKKLPEIDNLLVPGKHNIKDAQCALAVAEVLKIDLAKAQNSLKKFTGTWRRFEYKGQTKMGALVYDDYAHHPTEVGVTIEAAREFMKKNPSADGLPGKLIVAFQPHLYSRTKLLKEDFARVLAGANEVILAPIYAAREQADSEISSEILAELIRLKNPNVFSLPNLIEVAKKLKEEGKSGDLVITMGAGDIGTVGDKIIEPVA
ncbi:MAG: Mur ligase family protein [Candidatus Paceibacterota bacterium]|jgi:UDP-N-acetylmuramate--alanine ligase